MSSLGDSKSPKQGRDYSDALWQTCMIRVCKQFTNGRPLHAILFGYQRLNIEQRDVFFLIRSNKDGPAFQFHFNKLNFNK